jgi:DNA primase
MSNSRQIIYTVQSQYDAFDALMHYGKISTRTEQQILCPFHADNQKSARVYESSDRTGKPALWCFSCGRLWDGIAVVASMENLGYGAAAYLIYSRFGKQFSLLDVPEDWGEYSKPTSTAVVTESPYAEAWRQERSRLERLIRKSNKPLEDRIRLFLMQDIVEDQVRKNDQYLWEPKARLIREKLNT